MKYFCLGAAIDRVKVEHADKFWRNHGKIPVTLKRMESAFEASKELAFCKSLEDANTLRHCKLEGVEKFTAKRVPCKDYAIYEVEIIHDLTSRFSFLSQKSDKELKRLVSDALYAKTAPAQERWGLPLVRVFLGEKSIFNPTLIACHYLSLNDGKEVQPAGPSCNIL